MPTTDLPSIPADFPRSPGPSALTGAQPKVALVEIGGRLAPPGSDPDTLVQLHAQCESLAQQIAAHAKELLDQGRADPHRALKAQLNDLRKKIAVRTRTTSGSSGGWNSSMAGAPLITTHLAPTGLSSRQSRLTHSTQSPWST